MYKTANLRLLCRILGMQKEASMQKQADPNQQLLSLQRNSVDNGYHPGWWTPVMPPGLSRQQQQAILSIPRDIKGLPKDDMRQRVYDYTRRANAVYGGPKGVSDSIHRDILGAGKDLYRAAKRRLFGEKNLPDARRAYIPRDQVEEWWAK